MTETPNDFTQALAYCREQHADLNPPTKYGTTWHNDCQAFAHVAYGSLDGGFGSAFAQWLGTSPENRHVGGDPADAPVGALLFSKGTNPAGHVWIAARPFRDGTPGSWSPDFDASVFGGISKVPRTAPMTRWGHTFLGWGFEVNGMTLDLTKDVPVRPQTEPYRGIGSAIERLRDARDTARKQGDTADAHLLTTEIGRLRHMFDTMRRR